MWNANFLLLFIIFSVLSLQILIQWWKKVHEKSYNLVTLIFMWLFVGCASLYYGFVRMLFLWIIFSIYSTFYIYLATRPKLKSNTPRRVYKFLFQVHKFTHAVLYIGIISGIIHLLGVHLLIVNDPNWWIDHYLLSWFIPSPDVILFYGLYFGVMLRDLASILTSRMANTFESDEKRFYKSNSKYQEICNLCQGPMSSISEIERLEMQDDSRIELNVHKNRFSQDSLNEEENIPDVDEERTTLSCGHSLHEYCLRGWIILGKKDICPICKEKVDVSIFSSAPWQADSKFYINILEMTRYLVVWNPIIVFIVQVMIKVAHAAD